MTYFSLLNILVFTVSFLVAPTITADVCNKPIKQCFNSNPKHATNEIQYFIKEIANQYIHEPIWQIVSYENNSNEYDKKILIADVLSFPHVAFQGICSTKSIRMQSILSCGGNTACKLEPETTNVIEIDRVAIMASNKKKCSALSAENDYFDASITDLTENELLAAGRALWKIHSKERKHNSKSLSSMPSYMQSAFLNTPFVNVKQIRFDFPISDIVDQYSIVFAVPDRDEVLVLQMKIKNGKLLEYSFFRGIS